MPKNYGTLSGNTYPLVQNKKLEVDIDSVMLCTYNKENQIFTLISTIVKSYLFACKYAGKVPDPVECWNKILYYKDTEELIYLKHNKAH